MHFRKCFGYAVCPLLAGLLLAPTAARAQDTTSQQQPSSSSQTTPQTPPILMQEQLPKNEQEQRALILREAQARVNARKQARVREIIKETYNHQYEMYFGSGYLRFRPGAALQHNDEIEWNVGAVDYFHGNWGAAVDVRGYYGNVYTGRHSFVGAFHPSISQYTFMAGPQYRFFEGQHWGWTAQLLAGASHGNFATGTGGLGSVPVGLYNDGTVLTISPGVSVDYNVTPNVAIRLSPNAMFTSYTSSVPNTSSSYFQRQMGFNVDLLYRFGHQH